LKNGLDHSGVLAVVVMKMVRSDLATSGVMFRVDSDSENRNVRLVSSSYGTAESVGRGSVSPDSFLVWKEGLRRGRNPLVHRRMATRIGSGRVRIYESYEKVIVKKRALRKLMSEGVGLDGLAPEDRVFDPGDVVSILDERGLSPASGVPLFLLVELPSNVLDADRFIDVMGLSGRSIGSNDLGQTTYAVSRDALNMQGALPVNALVYRAESFGSP
jgi:phosphoenolpyruvate synthase/pyruvate phosphate dikinase